ncbi:MAG TPA: sensor domain-containing protein, partial [Micromonospora sp.]
MTSTSTVAPADPPRPRGLLRQLGVDTQYVLLGLPLSVITLVVSVVGFALGMGLLVTVVGLPVLVGTL